jgi:hypothetical protein
MYPQWTRNCLLAATAFGQFHLPPPPPPPWPATTLSPTIASATEIAGMTNQGRTKRIDDFP